jgi:hypothetical protein
VAVWQHPRAIRRAGIAALDLPLAMRKTRSTTIQYIVNQS